MKFAFPAPTVLIEACQTRFFWRRFLTGFGR